jgi:hypothetical protein
MWDAAMVSICASSCRKAGAVTPSALTCPPECCAHCSGADVTWGSQVPLGRPFSVRDPAWAWGRGRSLISGDGSASANIIAGLFFDGMTILLLYVLVVIVRDTSSRRSHA